MDLRISPLALQDVVGSYKIVVAGEIRNVTSHDLRRTYARVNYLNGMDVVAIQQNLGHANLTATLLYIGELSTDFRQPGAIYDFDIETLTAFNFIPAPEPEAA